MPSYSPLPRTAPRPASEQIADVHDDLYAAVLRGDIAVAQTLLAELVQIGGPQLRDRILTIKRKLGA